MYKEKSLNYKLFIATAVATTSLGIVLLLLSFFIGRNEFFLLLNTNLGPNADFFFRYFTHAGNGWWWIPWLIIFLKKQKHLLPLLFSSFLLNTLFIQVCKHLILPDVFRPVLVIEAQAQVHYVTGVVLHTTHSFPSGHTATAFTFLLLIALLAKKLWPVVIAAIGALLVGYSRIYLGQHFPLDVGAGMIVAACSVSLCLLLQRWYTKQRLPPIKQKVVQRQYDPVPLR